MIALEKDTEEQILDRPLIYLTCGRRSGSDVWNQGHPYSRTGRTYICRFLDDDSVADIRPALTRCHPTDKGDFKSGQVLCVCCHHNIKLHFG